MGAHIDIDGTGEADVWGRLWGESLGRIVIAVSPEHNDTFLATMKGHETTVLGRVTAEPTLVIEDGLDELLSLDVETMVEAWKGTLDLTGGVA